MKYAAYLLVIANLAVFAWLYSQSELYEPRSEPAVAPMYPPVTPLVLLKERGTTESETKLESSAPDADSPDVPGDAVPQPGSDVAATDPDDAGSPASDAVAESAEIPVASAPAVPEEPAPAEPPVRVCQTVGPFPGQKDVATFLARIKPLGANPTLRSAQTQQVSDYWVYLPEMPRAEARATARELGERGIKDLFLGKQNFISLGVFSGQRMAEARAKEIRDMGYEPRLEPRYRTREVFWVDLEEAGPDIIGADQWQTLLDTTGDVRRQSVACE